MDVPAAVVLVSGSRHTKAGLSSDDWPAYVTKTDDILPDHVFPVTDGEVTDVDVMECVWRHCFEKLEVDVEERGVLLTEDPRNNVTARDQMTQVMFETFETNRLYIAEDPVLALLSTGRLSGLVVDSGATYTQAVPVYDGQRLRSFSASPLAGHNVAMRLTRLLRTRVTLEVSTAHLLLEDGCCYVTGDPEEEGPDHEEYSLPDGTTVTLREERYQAPEVLFTPGEGEEGEEGSTLPDLALDTLNKTNPGIHRLLLGNTVLVGGNTTYEGMATRLETEMITRVDRADRTAVQVRAAGGGEMASWRGGAAVAQISSAQMTEHWLTREKYEEYGSSAVHRYFF